nr:glutathione binding-like protein [Pseudomonadota bacterium]
VLGTPEWIQYLFWLHFAEGSYMPNRLVGLVFELVHRRVPFFIKPITSMIKSQVFSARVVPRLNEQLNYIEATLEKAPWLAGDEFTAADIQMGAALILSGAQSSSEIPRPKLTDYIMRLENRPAYQRTIEVAGPLRFSLK